MLIIAWFGAFVNFVNFLHFHFEEKSMIAGFSATKKDEIGSFCDN